MKGILVTECLHWIGQDAQDVYCGRHEYVLEGTVYIPEIEVKLIRRFEVRYDSFSHEELNHIKKCFGDKLIGIEVDDGLIKKIYDIETEISEKRVEIARAEIKIARVERRRTSAIEELSRSIPTIEAAKKISA